MAGSGQAAAGRVRRGHTGGGAAVEAVGTEKERRQNCLPSVCPDHAGTADAVQKSLPGRAAGSLREGHVPHHARRRVRDMDRAPPCRPGMEPAAGIHPPGRGRRACHGHGFFRRLYGPGTGKAAGRTARLLHGQLQLCQGVPQGGVFPVPGAHEGSPGHRPLPQDTADIRASPGDPALLPPDVLALRAAGAHGARPGHLRRLHSARAKGTRPGLLRTGLESARGNRGKAPVSGGHCGERPGTSRSLDAVGGF